MSQPAAANPAIPVHYPPILLPPGSFDLVPVADLLAKVHPENPNKHPKAQIKLYIVNLEAGVRQAIIISSLSDRIVKGHGALQSAHLKGWTHWPVQYQDFASKDAEDAFLLADNQLAKLSKADEMSVGGILARLHAKTPEGFDVRLTGFSKKSAAGLLSKMKEVDKPAPEKPAKPLQLNVDPAWQTAADAAGLTLEKWAIAKLNAPTEPLL